ncbi:hypothetical protein HK096_001213, partial [Nowakowskiella sp. JEL0078]
MYIRDALLLFLQVASTLHFEKLREICNSFQNLGFHPEAIDLLLKYTNSQDPGGLAISFDEDGRPASDVVRGEFFEKRQRCYDLITNIVASVQNAGNDFEIKFRKRVLEKIFNSDDRLLHEYLYIWFIRQGLSEILLTIQDAETIPMRYIERFLAKPDSDIPWEIKTDMLWKYYGHMKNHDKAAIVLKGLANNI